MAITLEELEIKFSAEMGGLNSQLNSIKNQIGGIAAPTAQAHNALGGLSKLGKVFAGAAIGAKLLDIGKDSIAMANDAVESENLFEVSMGEMAGSTRKWSDDLSKSLGLNAIEVRKAAGTFNVMFNSMGIGAPKAQEMSQSLTALAQDMASFYNLSPDEAFQKLSAGITGEAEPLKRLGILIDENTIKTFAYENGIADMGSELTQNQKTLARYGAIMKQTSKAQGDLARTAESPANQLRRMTAQVDAAKIALGTALQPALLAVLPVLTSLATGAGNVFNAFNNLGESDGLNDVLLTLEDARKLAAEVVGTGFADIAKNIEEADRKTDEAITNFSTSEKATKDVLVELKFNPPTVSNYELVTAKLAGLRASIYALDGVVTKYIDAYLTPLLQSGDIDQIEYNKRVELLQKRMDDLKGQAAKLESKITAKIAAAMEDQQVTPKEKEAILTAITTEVNTATKGLTAIADKMKSQIAADLKAKKITPIEAAKAVELVDAELATALAGLTATADDLKASVGVGDWSLITITQKQAGELADKITKSINDSTVVVKATIDEVKAEFTGAGKIGLVVGTLYERLGTQITEQNEKIAGMIDGWTDGMGGPPTPEQVKAVMEEIDKRDRLMAMLNPKVGISGAMTMGLGSLTLDPSSIKNYFQAINEAVTSESEAALANFEKQKITLANAANMPEWDAVLAQYGMYGETYDSAVEKLRQQMLAALSAEKNNAIIESAKKLLPDIKAAIESGDMGGAVVALQTFLAGIGNDLGSLTPAAKQAALDMIDAFDLSALSPLMREELIKVKGMLNAGSPEIVSAFEKMMVDIGVSLRAGGISEADYAAIFGASNSRAALEKLASDFKESGNEMGAKLVEGLLAQIPNVTNTVGKAGKDITDSLRQALEDGQITKAQYDVIIGTEYSKESLAALAALMYKYGDKSAGDLVLGLLEKLTSVEEAARLLAEAAQAEPGSGYGAGSAYVQGLIEGLKSKEEELRQTANRIAALVDKNARRTMETKSPSKVAFRTGAYYGEGLALGMLDTTGMVSSAANKLSGSANLALGGLSASSFNVPSIDSSYGTIKSMVSEMMGAMSINLYVDQTQLGKAVFDAVRHLNAAYGFRS